MSFGIDIHLIFVAIFAALLTCILCLLILVSQEWHGRFSLDSLNGVQKLHVKPTPRVGGIAIFMGLMVASFSATEGVNDLLQAILWSSLPGFLIGVAEDLTKKIGVLERLLATMSCGLLAWFLTGVAIDRVEIIGIDSLLKVLPVSVAFTAFAVAGVINAFNIIDGFNGLASGMSVLCLSAIGVIAYFENDLILVQTAIVLIALAFGFMVINFPYGKIFLGDGGAYLLGFMVAWLAVLLPIRNPTVSVWSSLLACVYPVMEVLFSIFRRYNRQIHPGHPDRLHLHSLIKSRFVQKNLSGLSPSLQNAVVSPIVWGLQAGPALLAIIFYKHQTTLMIYLLISILLYIWLYRRLTSFARQLR